MKAFVSDHSYAKDAIIVHLRENQTLTPSSLQGARDNLEPSPST